MGAFFSKEVRRLPLHERHLEKGGRLGTFGEWEVPLYYTSILEEHEAVRTHAGLFDISHMGEFFLSGTNAESFLQELLPRDIPSLRVGAALYMPLLNERGGIVDDIILYRFGHDRFLMIVNAANIEKDERWIRAQLSPGVDFENQSEAKGLLALQGPESLLVLEQTLGSGFSSLDYYHFKEWENGMIARTGYTGEDGFEVMVEQKKLPEIWDRLFAVGAGLKPAPTLVPVGFGARDTLRLEAGMLLYGHDMDDHTSPFEAGIGWTIDLKKSSFVGRKAMLKQKEESIERKMIGFEMIDRGIPRHGCEIRKDNRLIGHVTSGSFSPTLKKNIGLGYVPIPEAEPEKEIEVIIRDKALKAKIVKTPFYKRKNN